MSTGCHLPLPLIMVQQLRSISLSLHRSTARRAAIGLSLKYTCETHPLSQLGFDFSLPQLAAPKPFPGIYQHTKLTRTSGALLIIIRNLKTVGWIFCRSLDSVIVHEVHMGFAHDFIVRGMDLSFDMIRCWGGVGQELEDVEQGIE
ncbi:hypothetical protein CGLO_16553 [Colletotrichum gloeosporioides Cg-14]|uniref:Uncharacterized protein n=1 Tax=Colletotrichum gloeosporioides (strain Cg-14) TaxID=1237896 RepID=T0JNA9_COLGC|nr:hypothetical protein CGLO_16553 [Colletotrichum gloeosporioides Cg-14]